MGKLLRHRRNVGRRIDRHAVRGDDADRRAAKPPGGRSDQGLWFANRGQDWLWYAILPSITYLALTVSAWLVNTETESALFTIAGAALVLVLIGVHNAWDSITHIVAGGADHA